MEDEEETKSIKFPFSSKNEELEFYKSNYESHKAEFSSYKNKIKTLENANYKLKEIIVKNFISTTPKNNMHSSSSSISTKKEFKQLYESTIQIDLIESFDFCINQYILISNMSQDILLFVYEETQNIINTKFKEILKCMNLENISKNKSLEIYLQILPFFRENLQIIFKLTDISIKAIHNKILNVIKIYDFNENVDLIEEENINKDNIINLIENKINTQNFDKLITNFFNICLYMILHDPILNFNIKKYNKDRKNVFYFYNQKEFINVEGFGNEKTPCILLIPPPLIKNNYPVYGLKPAVYTISEENEKIFKKYKIFESCNNENNDNKNDNPLYKNNNNPLFTKISSNKINISLNKNVKKTNNQNSKNKLISKNIFKRNVIQKNKNDYNSNEIKNMSEIKIKRTSKESKYTNFIYKNNCNPKYNCNNINMNLSNDKINKTLNQIIIQKDKNELYKFLTERIKKKYSNPNIKSNTKFNNTRNNRKYPLINKIMPKSYKTKKTKVTPNNKIIQNNTNNIPSNKNINNQSTQDMIIPKNLIKISDKFLDRRSFVDKEIRCNCLFKKNKLLKLYADSKLYNNSSFDNKHNINSPTNKTFNEYFPENDKFLYTNIKNYQNYISIEEISNKNSLYEGEISNRRIQSNIVNYGNITNKSTTNKYLFDLTNNSIDKIPVSSIKIYGCSKFNLIKNYITSSDINKNSYTKERHTHKNIFKNNVNNFQNFRNNSNIEKKNCNTILKSNNSNISFNGFECNSFGLFKDNNNKSKNYLNCKNIEQNKRNTHLNKKNNDIFSKMQKTNNLTNFLDFPNKIDITKVNNYLYVTDGNFLSAKNKNFSDKISYKIENNIKNNYPKKNSFGIIKLFKKKNNNVLYDKNKL